MQLRDCETQVLESTHTEPYIIVAGLQVQKTKEKKKKKKNKKRKRKHKKKKDSSDSDSSDSDSGSDSEERKRKKLKKVGESWGFGMVCFSHRSPSWNGVQACTFKLLLFLFLFLHVLLSSVVLCEVQSVLTWPFWYI